jgi:signal transduction histidine kinase
MQSKKNEISAGIASSLTELFLREEESGEILLNKGILFYIVPLLALAVLGICVFEGIHANVLLDAGAVLLALSYYAIMRSLLRSGRYRPWFKYLTVAVNVSICSLTLVAYSVPSTWIHSMRTMVVSSYILAIGLSGLYHEPRVPLFASALASAQYSLIVAWGLLVEGVATSPVETFFSPVFSWDGFIFYIFMFLAIGTIASWSARRFRSTLGRSLSSEARTRAVEELDAQKTDFFANISHELRTPLTLILAPLESMREDGLGYIKERHRGYIEVVYQNALRLLKLINDLLDFSKLEAGKMALSPQKTDLVAAVENYLSIARSTSEARGIRLGFKPVCGPSLPVNIDRYLFEKAFFNLLSNALKFTPSGGSIEVSISRDGPGLALAVRDTGIGIARDKFATIFERFNQVDPSSSRKYEGTGIGLSLTKDIVELHGGRVDVESVPGEGSTFTIRMPLGPIEDLRGPRASLLSDLGTVPAGAGTGTGPAGAEPGIGPCRRKPRSPPYPRGRGQQGDARVHRLDPRA